VPTVALLIWISILEEPAPLSDGIERVYWYAISARLPRFPLEKVEHAYLVAATEQRPRQVGTNEPGPHRSPEPSRERSYLVREA
jgi:hypothetical protein